MVVRRHPALQRFEAGSVGSNPIVNTVREKEEMDEREEFYKRCSEILGIEHEYHVPYKRRTRWNTRVLGNGRFPGFGLVQDFGGAVRIIPKGQATRWFDNRQSALDYLEIQKNTC